MTTIAEWLAQLDDQTRTTLWIFTVGSLTNVSCGLIGCFLVLRRMSLLGDALAHAVLPGLAVAFLLSGSLGIGYMFVGALAAGLLTTLLTQALHKHGGVPADASMGVVFTSLFALGVILIRRFASQVHIDTECVLEGLLDYVGLNTIPVAGLELPRQFLSIAPVFLLNVAFILLFWKELKISSFDPALSTTMSIPAGLMHYVLMALVALTAVASFEAVGSILVIAMLIAPGATAHLLCDRLGRMLWVAAGVGVISAIAGRLLAVQFDTNTAGMMAVVAGACFALAVVLSPRYGLASKMIRNARTSLRIFSEDLLGMLYRLEELAVQRSLGRGEAVQAVGGGLLAHWELSRLIRRGYVVSTADGVRLTEQGRRHARGLVRSHRLWEAYLVEHLGLPHDHVHAPAERMEHYIDERLAREISERLSDTEVDPHGRDIPAD